LRKNSFDHYLDNAKNSSKIAASTEILMRENKVYQSAAHSILSFSQTVSNKNKNLPQQNLQRIRN